MDDLARRGVARPRARRFLWCGFPMVVVEGIVAIVGVAVSFGV